MTAATRSQDHTTGAPQSPSRSRRSERRRVVRAEHRGAGARRRPLENSTVPDPAEHKDDRVGNVAEATRDKEGDAFAQNHSSNDGLGAGDAFSSANGNSNLVTAGYKDPLSLNAGPDAIPGHSDNSESNLELDVKLLLTAFSTLTTNASATLTLLMPRDISDDQIGAIQRTLQMRDNQLTRMLKVKRSALKADIACFGSGLYIDRNVAARILLNLEQSMASSQRCPGMEEVFQKGNLAILATELIDLSPNAKTVLRDLELLVESFPSPFVSAFASVSNRPVAYRSGTTKLIQETFDALLALRTLIVVQEFRIHYRDDNFETDSVLGKLASSFEDTGLFFHHKNTDSSSVIDDSTRRMLQKTIAARQARLKMLFKLIKQQRSCNELEKELPWNHLCCKVMTWILSRSQELDLQIKGKGGAEKIVDAVKAIRFKTTQVKPSPRFDYGNREAWLALNLRKGSMTFRHSTGNVARLDPTRPQNVSLSFSENDRLAIDEHNADRSTGAQASTKQNQKKTFFDRQSQATRVPEIDPIDDIDDTHEKSQSVGGDGALNSTLPSTDHTHVTLDQGFQEHTNVQEHVFTTVGESSDEDDFETDLRSIHKIAKQKELEPTTHNSKRKAPAPHQVELQEVEDQDHTDTIAENEAQRQRKRRRVEIAEVDERVERRKNADTMPTGSRLGSPDEDFADVDNVNNMTVTQIQERARQMNSISKPSQVRRNWSEAEADALVRYIEKYGTSYSHIKAKDTNGTNILAGRSQVDLKDKARLMKKNYLLVGATLPKNFRKIPLDKKLKDLLERRGITDFD